VSRPLKQGLDYFPLVTSFDDKVQLIIAEFGAVGIGILVSIYQKIYRDGYYINWDNDALMLLARHVNTEETTVNTVLTRLLDRDILSKDVYAKHQVLTSRGIQKQYLNVCKASRRKKVDMIKEYCLVKDKDLLRVITEETRVNAEETPINTEASSINTEETLINTEESTQRKVKERKVNKSINTIDDFDKQKVDDFFEKVWKLYPRKKGKGHISKAQKEKLFALGDEIERCIERFIRDMEGEARVREHYPYGSTFFNSGYVDYLDENYQDTAEDEALELDFLDD